MIEEMESLVNGNGFLQLQSCGERSEEELQVLPPHTKVVVTGNNRTKSVLVGLQGVVKKAVGLGGWHWLVLTNGIEVKLQRNALSVIEPPNGNEEDDDIEFVTFPWSSDNASDDTHRSYRSKHRMRNSSGSSRRTMSTLSRSFSSDSRSKGTGPTKIDLSKLEMAALLRYLRHFKLVDSIRNPSKEQLIDVVRRHFISQQLDELQVIPGFVQAAKRLKMVCK